MPSNDDSNNGSQNDFQHKYPVLKLSQSPSANHRNEQALEIDYFLSQGISNHHLEQALKQSQTNQTTLEDELIYCGIIDRSDHFKKIAAYLNVLYQDELSDFNVIQNGYIDMLLTRNGPLRVEQAGSLFTVLAPTLQEARRLKDRFQLNSKLKSQFIITSPLSIRDAVWETRKADRVKESVRNLAESQPKMSAKSLVTGWQGFALGALITCLVFSLYLSSSVLLSALHLFFSLVYLSFNLLKLSAGFFPRPKQPNKLTYSDDCLPTYTILVALYKEAALAKQILASLSRINWPKSKLDIKIICEEDDQETLNAFASENPGPQFEIIKVPNYGPRTKPKALQYALSGAKGELVTIYDAEDIPHPDQLLEAYEQFCNHDETLACLQAPLVITNSGDGWLPAMFALEYSSLFRKLIPLLAHFGLPIPLGGTSNHFRGVR